MRKLTWLAALLVVPALAAAEDDAAKKEAKALAGRWKAVGGERDGNVLPKDGVPPIAFTLKADGTAEGETPEGMFKATMTFKADAKPKALDITHQEGTWAGQKQFGIYKVEKDQLTVCVPAPGGAVADRPKDFATGGTQNLTMVFERVKDQ